MSGGIPLRVHYSEVVTKPHLIDLVEDDWLDTLPEDAVPLPAHAQLPLADDDELAGAGAGAASVAPPPARRETWHEMALHELG